MKFIRLCIKTLQQNEDGEILMDLAKVKLVNPELLQRVIFDEKNLGILLDLSNSILKEYPVGAVLRYSPSNVEQILSFELVKPLLPDNLIFNRENIARLIIKSQEEKDFEALAYYKNLADIHLLAMEVTRWCKENRHFHIGFDVLLGRNSEGQWRFCLTELNNVWPDCIPETRRINRDCLEEESKIDICKTIVESIMSNQYISRIDPQASISLDR